MKIIAALWFMRVRNLAAADKIPAFRAQTIDDKIEIGYGLAIADVDGDGKPDILLADKKQFVWYQNPDVDEARHRGKPHGAGQRLHRRAGHRRRRQVRDRRRRGVESGRHGEQRRGLLSDPARRPHAEVGGR